MPRRCGSHEALSACVGLLPRFQRDWPSWR